jgi:positive regulator of sigma E activity
MDTPRGRILSIERDAAPPRAVVEVARSLGCARCAAGKGCGAALAGPDAQPRRIEVHLAAGLDLDEGDEVCIELAPHNVLRAAMIVYGLPLGGAVTGAAVAYLAGAGDPGAACAALVGLGAGLVAGRYRLRQSSCLEHFTPVITGRVASIGR